jgi:hypothetical protein
LFKGELLIDADHAPWLVDAHRTALKVAKSDSKDGNTVPELGGVLSAQCSRRE